MAELLKVLDGNTIPLLIRVYKKVEGNVREALPLDEVKNLQLRLVRREDNFVVKLVPHLRNVNEIYVRLFDQAPPPANPYAPLFRGDAEMRPPIPEDAPPTPFRNTYPPERPAGGFNSYMKGTWGIELSGIYGTYKMRSLELRRIRVVHHNGEGNVTFTEIDGEDVVPIDMTIQLFSGAAYIVDDEILENSENPVAGGTIFEAMQRHREILQDAVDEAVDLMDNMDEGETARATAEQLRRNAETAREGAESQRAANEVARQSAFETSEAARQTAFQASEAGRTTTFQASEAARQSAFQASEAGRQSTFNTNEAERQAAENAREGRMLAVESAIVDHDDRINNNMKVLSQSDLICFSTVDGNISSNEVSGVGYVFGTDGLIATTETANNYVRYYLTKLHKGDIVCFGWKPKSGNAPTMRFGMYATDPATYLESNDNIAGIQLTGVKEYPISNTDYAIEYVVPCDGWLFYRYYYTDSYWALDRAHVRIYYANSLKENTDQLIEDLNGKNLLVYKRLNYCIWGKTDNMSRYWFNTPGYHTYIFDVTSLVGKGSISFYISGHNNTANYSFYKDWHIFDGSSSSNPVDVTDYLLYDDANGSTGTGKQTKTNSMSGSAITTHVNNGGHVYLRCHLYASHEQVTLMSKDEIGLKQEVENLKTEVGSLDIPDEIHVDDSLVENSSNPVAGGAVKAVTDDIYSKITDYDGTLKPVYIKRGSLVNANSGSSNNRGSWISGTNDVSYIFDVTEQIGKKVNIICFNKANRRNYIFIPDYENFPTSDPGEENWPNCYINVGQKATSTTYYTPKSINDVTIPAAVTAAGNPCEHVYLVVSGYIANGDSDIVPIAKIPTNAYVVIPKKTSDLTNDTGFVTYDELENTEDILKMYPKSKFLPIVQNMVHLRYYSSYDPPRQKQPILFAHFSDIHGMGTSLARMLAWCNEYSSYISAIIHTGDSVNEKYSDGMGFWDNVEGSANILNIIGNHDRSSTGNGNGQGVTNVEAYNLIIKPYLPTWNVVQPEDAEANGYSYWYKDFTKTNTNGVTNKVRLIGTDCLNHTTAQLNWLKSVLVDAANNGITVVIAHHSSPRSTNYEYIKSPFTGAATGSHGAYSWADACAAVDDFKAGTLEGQAQAGDFACWLCGHTHKDAISWQNGSQLVITIDSMTTGISGRNRVVSTIYSKDCFNLVAIDPYCHTVKIARVGNEWDDQLRHIDTCCINYLTGQVVDWENTEHQQLKTINNQSLVGEGNIEIGGGSGGSGEANVIETVKVNGIALQVTDKTVNIDLSGKQDTIDTSHKLSADLISDGETNKVINVKPDWNAASGSAAEILNKPTIPSEVTESTVSDWGFTKNAGTYSKPSGGIPASDLASGVIPDITGKEDKMAIDGTAKVAAFNASAGNYYFVDCTSGGFTITLTTPSDATHVNGIVFLVTTGSTEGYIPSFSGVQYYADGFEMKTNNTYEVDAMYNGSGWVLALIKLNSATS